MSAAKNDITLNLFLNYLVLLIFIRRDTNFFSLLHEMNYIVTELYLFF